MIAGTSALPHPASCPPPTPAPTPAPLQVVVVLKKEMMKTQSKDLEKGAEYRQLLVQAIHTCAVRFPDVAGEAARRGRGGGGVCV